MKIAVLPNLDKRGAGDVVNNLGRLFKKWGMTAYLPENICGTDYLHMPEAQLYDVADVIVTVGGDGTIIRYGKLAAKHNKPILGINAGRLGFLADIEPRELNLLEKLKTADFSTENRMILKVTVTDQNKDPLTFYAINDVVITCGYISRIVDIKANIGGDCISYRADGLIVSTPTGSTAYSMSAGGPIMDPLSENICITPICSHSLSAKPIILNKNSVVKLSAFSLKHADICLMVDGRKTVSVKPTTQITVTRADYDLQLIRLVNKSFYKTVSEKFRER